MVNRSSYMGEYHNQQYKGRYDEGLYNVSHFLPFREG
jgi:hypothetical protein